MFFWVPVLVSKKSIVKRQRILPFNYDHGYKIVFGGGNVGLMGILADAALAANGHVTGIITEQLNGVEVGIRG
ncbi:MAG: hypothetical protein Ct9H300mP4_04420 [Gammaproteobacteria bacterium]|nr:MAG: hypothetical protein Ct9H300mP4_04420 [Gammaproteobacteria bacterium]